MDFNQLETGSLCKQLCAIQHTLGYLPSDQPFEIMQQVFGTANVRQYHIDESEGIWPDISVSRLWDIPVISFSGLDARNPDHTRTVLAVWSGQRGACGRHGLPIQLMLDTVDRVQDAINPTGISADVDWSKCIVSGHSYGGLFAMLYSQWLMTDPNTPVRNHQLYTFGMPAVALRERTTTAARDRPHWRMIRMADLVPNLPPKPDESWSAYILERYILSGWQLMEHEAEGAYRNNATWQYRWNTQAQAGELGTGVGDWLLEFPMGRDPSHHISAYWRDLHDVVYHQPGVNVVDPSVRRPRGEDQPPNPVKDVKVKDIAGQARRDATAIGVAHARVRAPRPFTVEKIGGTHTLLLEGTAVATYHTSRGARRARDKGNSLAYHMCRGLDLDQAAWGRMMETLATLIEGSWDA